MSGNKPTRATQVSFAALVCATQAFGQTAIQARAPADPPPPEFQYEPNKWSFSAWIYAYLVPDSRDYVQPSFAADHGGLHLEARYNDPQLDSGSAWIGYNAEGGDEWSWRVTPMLGGVFGDTSGIAPGFEASVSWWRLELYSEADYVFDVGDASESFFYNWSELSFSPVDWFRFGLAAHTRVYQNDHDLEGGVLAGVLYKKASLTAYVFNLDASRPTLVFAAGLSF